MNKSDGLRTGDICVRHTQLLFQTLDFLSVRCSQCRSSFLVIGFLCNLSSEVFAEVARQRGIARLRAQALKKQGVAHMALNCEIGQRPGVAAKQQ